MQSLLAKRAIEMANSVSCFYSHDFLISKKDGGLRHIVNLRHLEPSN